jgi:two-component system sensor histidine kinase BaeS
VAPPSLRRRLTLAFAGVAVAVLVLTGGLLLVLARANAIRVAQDELVESGEALVELQQLLRTAPVQDRPAGQARFLIALRPALRANGAAAVLVRPDGTVQVLTELLPAGDVGSDGLPEGVDLDDVDVDAVRAGEATSGHDHGTVYAVVPLEELAGGGVPAIVLAREVGLIEVGRLGGSLVLAAGLSVVVVLIGSALLARRLTRPLQAMERTARSIAAGDLTARVGEVDGGEGELGSLAAALDGMAVQLEASRGAERAFLLSVSHDLRTPLTAIRGYAEAVGDGAVDDDASRARAAAVIAAEARRLERLVADLLDLARLDARSFSLHPDRIDVAPVVTDAAHALAPAAADAGLVLVVDAPAGAWAVADAQRLGQVVGNLVENAVKYAAERVGVTVGRVAGSPAGPPAVVVEVADDGPGIDPADLPHVFERLYASRKVTGRKVGTGLGLAIAHDLVAAMGGTIAVAPGPLGGTVVTVRLPAA